MAKAKTLDQAVEILEGLPDRITGVRGDLDDILGIIKDLGSIKKLVDDGAKLIQQKLAERDALNAEIEPIRDKLTEMRRELADIEEKGKVIVNAAKAGAREVLEAADRKANETTTKADVEAYQIVSGAKAKADAAKTEAQAELKALEGRKSKALEEARAAEKLLSDLNGEIEAIRKRVA